MDSLQILTGLSISKIKKVHDYIQVIFYGGTTLNIFNNHDYDRGSALAVRDKKVKSVERTGSTIVITLDDGSCLSIGMDNDDYNGPEAIELSREGKPPVVWN